MAKFDPKPFGKYFLIDKLATGGMAEIYKAKTYGVDGFEKLLAIKRILPHCSTDTEFVKMLIDEAKLSVLLSHTNIVQVYDLGKVGEDYFISMEFINGTNLREVLARLKDLQEKLDEELVLYLISEVCKGLDYAHSKKDAEGNPLNIVHRDISPQNILLSFEGEVKIVDFGIAKAAMNISHTMAGILKGKISYMSPEQALGKPIDQKTDIFSTGLMMYELLMGEKFFTGETQFEVLKKIRTTRINEKTFGDKFSEPVSKMLAKALAYSVKDRYESAGDFQIDLTRYLYTTYADFTPRKLKKLMGHLFASEIQVKKSREEAKAEPLDSQTRSVIANPSAQQNIVHRAQTAEQTLTGSEKQPTQTFIEAFISGQEAGEPALESSYTRTQHAPAAPMESAEDLELEELPELEQTPTPIPVQEPAPEPGPPSEQPRKKPSLPLWRQKVLKKILWPAVAILVLGLGTWGLVHWLQGPGAPPAVASGVLQLQSTPEGAQILINDSETNKLTPATIDTLEVGKPQKITLKKPKYKDWSKTITLLDPTPVSLNPTLEVIPVGSIHVASTPPGAKILLDGEDTGKVTPTTLEDLPLSKTYALKLEMDKHLPVEENITLYSIEPVNFEKKLEEIKFGTLKINSVPPGATVLLNNNNTGEKTPTTIANLEVGKRFTIQLSHAGYQDVTRSVDIQNETPIVVKETLAKIPEKPVTKTVQETMKETTKKLKQLETEKQKTLEKPKVVEKPKLAEQPPPAKETQAAKTEAKTQKGSEAVVAYVSVSSNPKGADVFIIGVKSGRTPGKFKVKAGTSSEITVSKSGLSTQTKVVTLRPGETRNLGTFNLEGEGSPGAAGTSVILIDSNPPGAMVLLNGKPQKATPLRIKGLRPGTNYTFTVKKEGYQTWTQSVTVGEGSKSYMANLKKL